MSGRLGLDWTGSTLRTVRPRFDDSLVSFDTATANNQGALTVDHECVTAISLCLPSSEALVRIVRLAEASDWQARTLFELSQSLLEPLETYLIVLEQPSPAHRVIAVLVRKSRLKEIANHLGLNGAHEQLTVLPRGLALAAGYRTFCTRPSADLICLIEIDTSATVCLIYRDQPLVLGDVSIPAETDETLLARLAMDLRTWVNLQATALERESLPTALGSVLVTGALADDHLVAELGKQFLCPVSPVTWLTDLAPLDKDGQPLSMAYLAALGTLAK